LRTLEQYLGTTSFLRHLIPYYAQLAEPLQKRKVALLAESRAKGRVEVGNKNKRAAYTRATVYEPTAAELASFDALQHEICKEGSPNILHYHDPDRQLFLKVDGSLERGYGVILFHCKDGFIWKEGSPIPSN
jgi:hypothetical protein